MSRSAGTRVTDNDHIKAADMAVEETINDSCTERVFNILSKQYFLTNHLFFSSAFDEYSPIGKDLIGLRRETSKTLLPFRDVKNVRKGKPNTKRQVEAQ